MGFYRCNSDYRLRFCNLQRTLISVLYLYSCNSDYRLRFCNFLQLHHGVYLKCCNSDYRLRFCNSCFFSNAKFAASCNSDYRLRFCNYSPPFTRFWYRVATAITACGFVTRNLAATSQNAVSSCNSDYRLRFCNSLYATQ